VKADTLPRRPGHWLPNEPMVWALPETEDGCIEVTLELGGKIVASGVASDHESARRVFDRFQVVIREALAEGGKP
jgi:hypothetical protein